MKPNGRTETFTAAPTPHYRRAIRTARGLGWFSIGLGLAELLAPKWVARATGLQGSEQLLRAYGLREIATGVGLLLSANPKPWVMARIAGDGLDLATLGTSHHAGKGVAAAAAVAGVTALDVACVRMLSEATTPHTPTHDYSDRVGLALSPEEMRGKACDDFETPRDMRAPEALQPHAVH